MLSYVHVKVAAKNQQTNKKSFDVLFLYTTDWVIMCLLICLSEIWTRQTSGLLQYQQCTYYDDCAITSVFLFCKSESLEGQRRNKVYIFLPHLMSDLVFFLKGQFAQIWNFTHLLLTPVLMEPLVTLSDPCNHCGVAQMERIPPDGCLP